jgi:hypothetical protein
MVEAMKKAAAKTADIEIIGGIGYGNGSLMKMNIISNPVFISQSQGPEIDGTRRELTIPAGSIKVATDKSGDFTLNNASGSLFYLGAVEVKNAAGTATESSFSSTIAMKDQTDGTFALSEYPMMQLQNGDKLKAEIRISDLSLTLSDGNMATFLAPYFKISAVYENEFSIGSNSGHNILIGKAQVGNTIYDNAVVLRDNASGEWHMSRLSGETHTAIKAPVKVIRPQKIEQGEMITKVGRGYVFNLPGSNHTLNVIDINGKIVRKFENISNGNTLDVKGIASGTYIIADTKVKASYKLVVR